MLEHVRRQHEVVAAVGKEVRIGGFGNKLLPRFAPRIEAKSALGPDLTFPQGLMVEITVVDARGQGIDGENATRGKDRTRPPEFNAGFSRERVALPRVAAQPVRDDLVYQFVK